MNVWCRLGKKSLYAQFRVLRSQSHPNALHRCPKWRRMIHGGAGGRSCSGWVKQFGVAVPGSLAVYHVLKPVAHLTAHCKQNQHVPINRLSHAITLSDTFQGFNWSLFLKFILPDILLLMIAIGVSVC